MSTAATTQRIPLIDLSDLSEPRGLRRVAREIGLAARSVGFFSVINHGIAHNTIADVFAVSQAFFNQPEMLKNRVSFKRSRDYFGYSPLGAEQLDPLRPGDAKESYNMGRELGPTDPDFGKPFCGPNLWPEIPRFRDALTSYFGAAHSLVLALHRAIAIDLGADPSTFDGLLDRTLGVLRLLHYPPHPTVFDDGLYGAAPHTDYGNLTLLAQDENGGLDVRSRDGSWIAVEPVPGTLVCNIGDALMRWSNDIYVSTPHRVVNRSGRERYSVAFFGDPNADASIACLPACCEPGATPNYKPIDYGDYLRMRLDATYGQVSDASDSPT